MKRYIAFAALVVSITSAKANADCSRLPDAASIKAALTRARHADIGGFGLDMWGTVVDRAGTVCAVTYTGDSVSAQWPGSRLISAAKAYTANAFSLRVGPLSTANLFAAVQPGGSLYGLSEGNPLDAARAYAGPVEHFGTPKDPLVGHRVGGIITFGGGLALYDATGELVGGLGVSGDSSCADHNIAWRTRAYLELDHLPGSPIPGASSDQIIFDVTNGVSAGGWGHPACGAAAQSISRSLTPPRAIAR